MNRTSLLVAALAASVCVSTQAAMITGVSVAVNAPVTTHPAYAISRLTDGSGLTAPVSLTSTQGNVSADMWMTNGATAATLVFDLGQDYNLDGMAIWQYNQSAGTAARGAKTYLVDYSLDNLSYTQLQASAQLPMGTGAAGLASTQVNVPANTMARYVRIAIANNWGDSSYVGLSEVQFSGTVPEPVSLGTMLAASGGLLFRRRVKSA